MVSHKTYLILVLVLLFMQFKTRADPPLDKYVYIRQIGNTNVYFWPIYIIREGRKISEREQYTRYFEVNEDVYLKIETFLLRYNENNVDTSLKLIDPGCFNCYEITINQPRVKVSFAVKSDREAETFFENFLPIIKRSRGTKQLRFAMKEIVDEIKEYNQQAPASL